MKARRRARRTQYRVRNARDAGPGRLQLSHVPMVVKEPRDGSWCLESHVARPNPHWNAAASASGSSVAVFVGPQAYVSPSWYATKREHGRVVPTWNYIAVHTHGMLEAVEDEPWLHAHLADLTRANEAEREQPWEVGDAPADYIDGLARGIVGLRLTVTRIEAAWKMAQHRSEADRLGDLWLGIRSPRPSRCDAHARTRSSALERARGTRTKAGPPC